MSQAAGGPLQIGRYRVLDELGRGGMGVVFRAVAPDGGQVAIKLVLAERLLNPTSLARFEREARALDRLNHPGVVRLREVGVYDACPYLVMDLVEGRSLQERLDDQGPLPVAEALGLAIELARTLEHLHQSGLLHRDVKPDNVLLLPDGRPLLTDFGLVKLLDESQDPLSQTGHMLGTPGYWAPEQARGELRQLGPHTDVYGVGATLYACLTGRPPVNAETLLELLRGDFEVEPPSTVRAGLEAWIDAVCLRALCAEPAGRYPRAADLAAALEGGPGARRGARRGVAALAVAVVFLGFTLAGAVAVGRTQHREPVSPSPPPSLAASPESPLPVGVEEPPAPEAVEAAPSLDELDRRLRENGLTGEARARAHLERGKLRLAARDFDGAFSDYNQAVSHAPALAEAYLARGGTRALMGNREGAQRDLERALELDPDDPLIYLSRAAYRHQLGLIDLALEDLARVERLAPELPQLYSTRAQIWSHSGSFARARDDYEAYLRVAPPPRTSEERQRLLAVWNGLGVARARSGDHTGGIEAYSRSLELDDQQIPIFYNRGLAHARRDEFTAAIRDLGASLALRPAANVFVQRAFNRIKIHDSRGALEDAEAATTLEPSSSEAWMCLAHARLMLGRVEAAREAIERSVALEPTFSGYVTRARLRALANDFEGARRDFNQGLKLDQEAYSDLWLAMLSGDTAVLQRPSREASWEGGLAAFVLGRISLRQLLGRAAETGDDQLLRMRACEAYCFAGVLAELSGDRGRARHHYEAALATSVVRYFEYQWSRARLSREGLVHHVEPRADEGLLEQARERLREADHAGALAALDSLAEAGPLDLEGWLLRASACEAMGRELDALDALDAALELDPASGDAAAARGRLRLLRGDALEAMADFSLALDALPDRAPALRVWRGRAFQAAGRDEDARADYEAALAAGAPSAARRLAGLGFARGEEPAAVVARLGDGPLHGESLRLRAWARLLQGDPDAARVDLRAALGDDASGRIAACWLVLLGDDAPARALIGGETWATALAEMLTSPRSLDDLLSLARSASDPREQAARRCEAYVFGGVEAEQAGERQLARERYQAALQTGAVQCGAYAWARRRLADDVRPLAW